MPGLGMQERSSKSQASVTYPSVKSGTNKAWKKRRRAPSRKRQGKWTTKRGTRGKSRVRQGEVSKSDDKNTQNPPWPLSLSPLPREAIRRERVARGGGEKVWSGEGGRAEQAKPRGWLV